MGTIAKELLCGPILPLLEYQTPQEGGMILNGILITPFFLLFGETGISLKLAWLTTALFLLILIFTFSNVFFSRRTALIASLIFIFSPPLFIYFNLTDTATNGGNLVISFLIMISLILSLSNPGKKAFYSILGLLCGFSVYYDYYSVIMVATCMMFWYACDKKLIFRVNFRVFIFSSLLGASPWIYYNMTHNNEALAKFLMPMSLPEISIKLVRVFLIELPKSFGFKNQIAQEGTWIDYSYYTLFIALYVFLLYSHRSTLKAFLLSLITSGNLKISNGSLQKTFILIYPLCYLFGYSMLKISTHGEFSRSRYLLPIYPFIFILLALGIDEMLRRDMDNAGYRLIPKIILFLIIAIGLWGNLSLLPASCGKVAKKMAYRPYHGSWVTERLNSFKRNSNLNEESFLQMKAAVEKRYGKECYEKLD